MRARLLETTIKIGLSSIFLCFSGLLFANDKTMPDAETLTLLQSGEVAVETIRAEESGGAGRFQIFLKAPVEDIWSVIYSCEHAFIYLNGLRVCEVLEDDGINTLTRQVVKTSWLIPRQDFTFRTLREPFRRATFERTSGSPRVMEGSWEFLKVPGGVVAMHELRVKPSLPVPRFLVRHLMQRSMPKMLVCIRALSGGSLNDEQEREDFAACPNSRK